MLCPTLEKLLPAYPDIKAELVTDYGLTDTVPERYDAVVRLSYRIALLGFRAALKILSHHSRRLRRAANNWATSANFARKGRKSVLRIFDPYP